MRWPRWSALTQIIGALIATLATGIYLTQSLLDQHQTKRTLDDSEKIFLEIQHKANQELANLDRAKVANDELIKRLQESSTVPKDQAQMQLALLQRDITSVRSDLTTLSAGVDNLNAALGTTPEKAIAMPLLKKDLDDFRIATQRDIDSIRGEMTRSYDLNKWLIGLILAVLLGTLFSNALQVRSATKGTAANHE